MTDREIVQAADPTAHLVYLQESAQFVVRHRPRVCPASASTGDMRSVIEHDLSSAWQSESMAWFEAKRRLGC